jgi:hypothetical protein
VTVDVCLIGPSSGEVSKMESTECARAGKRRRRVLERARELVGAKSFRGTGFVGSVGLGPMNSLSLIGVLGGAGGSIIVRRASGVEWGLARTDKR